MGKHARDSLPFISPWVEASETSSFREAGALRTFQPAASTPRANESEVGSLATDNVFVPQQGAISDLASWIAGDLGSAAVRLYVNNVVYGPTRVCSDYTEASFSGYSPISSPPWGVPFTNSGGKGETDSPALNFTFTGASGTFPIFGMFVTDPSQTKLLLVVPFVIPFVFSPTNPNLSTVLQVTEVSEL